TWVTAGQAVDPKYWGRHLRGTVRFAEGIATLWREPHVMLLEVGPRTTLATLARQATTDKAKQLCASTLNDTPQTEVGSLWSAIGGLWCAGVEPNGNAVHAQAKRRRTPLPTYPFERARFWVDPAREPSATSFVAQSTAATGAEPISPETRLEEPMPASRIPA